MAYTTRTRVANLSLVSQAVVECLPGELTGAQLFHIFAVIAMEVLIEYCINSFLKVNQFI